MNMKAKNDYEMKVAAVMLLKKAMDALDNAVNAITNFEQEFDVDCSKEKLVERIQKLVPYDAHIIREILCAEEVVLEEDEGWNDDDWEDDKDE